MKRDPTSRFPADKPAPRRLARAEAVLASRRRGLTVVLEDAHDPHNISAVLRTCDALGIQDVHLVAEDQPTSVLNPNVTIGAERWLTVHRHVGSKTALAALRRAGYSIFVSHLDPRAVSIVDLPAAHRAAYVFGNERSGVTTRWIEAADSTFWIPTSGFSGSLNLSVAVALTLYDRLLRAPGAGDLTEDEKANLRSEWYERLAGGSDFKRDAYRAFLQHPVPPSTTFANDRRDAKPNRASEDRAG